MKRPLPISVVLAVLLVGACNGATPAQQDDDGPIRGELQVQASGGESEIKALEELVTAFEEEYPGVDVDLVGIADQGEHISTLLTAFAGGAPPDVFLLNYRRLGPFVEKDVIEPAVLEELSAGDFYAPSVEAFTFDGKLACLPQNTSSVVTYVNPTLFARAGVALPRPGWNWPEAVTTARALAAAKIEAIGFDPNLRTLSSFVWSAGGEVVDDTDDPTRITLDTDPGRAALAFLLDLQESGLDASERAAQGAQDRFARGELAMYLDSRRSVPAFRKAPGLTFDVRPLPQDKEPASLLASDGYCVTRASENRRAAHAFASFAVGEMGGPVLARTGRTVPSLRALAESPVFLDPAAPPASAKVFLDVIPTLRALPSVAAWDEAEELASDVLEQVFAGRLGVDAALRKIEKDTAAAFAR